MPTTYYVGDKPRLSGPFDDINDVDADPTAVSLDVMNPAGTITTYTFAASQVVKDSTGNYHYDLSLTAEGMWTYRWRGEGALNAAKKGELFVERTRF